LKVLPTTRSVANDNSVYTYGGKLPTAVQRRPVDLWQHANARGTSACNKSYAWFPPSRIRKNSVDYVKITFSVSVSSPLPLIRSYTIEFYFSVPAVPYVARTPGAPPSLLRGKLAGLPPGPAALLPRTRPSNGIRNGRYGHGFYGNGNGNGNVTVETRCYTFKHLETVLYEVC